MNIFDAMAWANIVEETNVWTLISLLLARVFGSSENSMRTAASEIGNGCLDGWTSNLKIQKRPAKGDLVDSTVSNAIRLDVAVGSKTDFDPRLLHFRTTPNNGHSGARSASPKSARLGH